MRIKVGEVWFEVKPDRPIMVELTKHDRANIAGMHPQATKYAVFHDEDQLTAEQRYEWMSL